MLESAEGANTSATRQKSGSPVIGEPVGGVNVPPVTVWAVVIVVNGIATLARLSHVAANVEPAVKAVAASTHAAIVRGAEIGLFFGWWFAKSAALIRVPRTAQWLRFICTSSKINSADAHA